MAQPTRPSRPTPPLRHAPPSRPPPPSQSTALQEDKVSDLFCGGEIPADRVLWYREGKGPNDKDTKRVHFTPWECHCLEMTYREYQDEQEVLRSTGRGSMGSYGRSMLRSTGGSGLMDGSGTPDAFEPPQRDIVSSVVNPDKDELRWKVSVQGDLFDVDVVQRTYEPVYWKPRPKSIEHWSVHRSTWTASSTGDPTRAIDEKTCAELETAFAFEVWKDELTSHFNLSSGDSARFYNQHEVYLYRGDRSSKMAVRMMSSGPSRPVPGRPSSVSPVRSTTKRTISESSTPAETIAPEAIAYGDVIKQEEDTAAVVPEGTDTSPELLSIQDTATKPATAGKAEKLVGRRLMRGMVLLEANKMKTSGSASSAQSGTCSTDKQSTDKRDGSAERGKPSPKVHNTTVPISHVVFVVHGIGQALTEYCDVIRDVESIRVTSKVLTQEHFPQVTGSKRIIFIPIEWRRDLGKIHGDEYEEDGDFLVEEAELMKEAEAMLNGESSEQKSGGSGSEPGSNVTSPKLTSENDPDTEKALKEDGTVNSLTSVGGIQLNTIPGLRHVVQGSLLDILLYLSNRNGQKIIDNAVGKLNNAYRLFRRRHPKFDGKVSIIGHSLGSLITFDILTHQPNAPTARFRADGTRARPRDKIHDAQHLIKDKEVRELEAQIKDLQIKLRKRLEEAYGRVSVSLSGVVPRNFPALDFEVDCFFMLGSPLGVFLLLRDHRIGPPGTGSTGHAGQSVMPKCRRFYNVFHPYDPVAYRIEPIIEPSMAKLKPQNIPFYKKSMLAFTEDDLRSVSEASMRARNAVVNTVARIGTLVSATARLRSWAYGGNKGSTEEGVIEQPAEALKPNTESAPDGLPISREDSDNGGTRDITSGMISDVDVDNATGKVRRVTKDELLARMPEEIASLSDGDRRFDHQLRAGAFDNQYLTSITAHMGYSSDPSTVVFLLSRLYGLPSWKTDKQERVASQERVRDTNTKERREA
eukprot:Clim_evm18s99 gene=Clim_evmTU18s99